MLSEDRSRILTHTGPDTPGGDLLRRYWQPVALSSELTVRDPLPLTILSEELVLFRNTDGNVGMLGRSCCHRGIDLSYGRVEDGGLRCVYHGWLFATNGQCLEQPGEPESSTFYKSVKQKSYPCMEVGGLIFVYMGPGEPPLLPALELFRAEPDHRHPIKLLQSCNYMQANEGNLDPVHQSFLHRFCGDQEKSTQFKVREPVGGTNLTNYTLYAENARPNIDIEDTPYGIRAFISRPFPGKGTFLKIYNFVMPNLSIIPGGAGADGYMINWHVPINDTTHWKFCVVFNRANTIDVAKLQHAIIPEMESRYVARRNASNRYLQDRASMKDGWFTGLGPCFVDHDTFATEMQGPIQDRSQETFATSDKIIHRARKLMFDGIEDIKQNRDPQGVIRSKPQDWAAQMKVVSEFFTEQENWKQDWAKRAAMRELVNG
jgi:phenylpropionate dioxygenase-like ring-hydroxylating dioxygenase large terminal subunit